MFILCLNTTNYNPAFLTVLVVKLCYAVLPVTVRDGTRMVQFQQTSVVKGVHYQQMLLWVV